MNLVPVHCRGCGRRVAVATRDYAVWCTAACADIPAASQDEVRDSMIETMAHLGKSPVQIAIHFDLTRQRVHQILQERHAPRT